MNLLNKIFDKSITFFVVIIVFVIVLGRISTQLRIVIFKILHLEVASNLTQILTR